MEQIRFTSEDRSFRRLMGSMALALLLFYMICPVAPLRWNDLYSSYGRTLIIAMAALYFFKWRFKGCIEVKIVIAYALWLLVTRILNTDIYLQNEYDLVVSRFLCAVILPVGMLLERSEREKLLDIIIAVMGLFYFVTALLALFACIFGVYFYIPPENVAFGIDNDFMVNMFAYVVAWETNRTIAAVWFYYGWCMMAYEFFHCRNRLWRIPICIAWFVFHLTLAFCFCRSIKLVICGNVAMLLILLGMKHLRMKKNSVKILVIVLAAIISMPLSYKSFDVLTDLSARAYNALDTDIERTSNEFMGSVNEENADDEQSFEDARNLKTSLSNMSNRGEIYASIIPTLKDDPMRLLIGKYSDKIMDVPLTHLSYPYFHMHNFLVQTLMLTGLLGFLLAAAFTVLMVIRMIRLFFSQAPELSMEIKMLCLPLSGIFIYGMFEIILFTASADDRALTDFRELFFFLLAGCLLGYYYETFPPRKRKEKIK